SPCRRSRTRRPTLRHCNRSAGRGSAARRGRRSSGEPAGCRGRVAGDPSWLFSVGEPRGDTPGGPGSGEPARPAYCRARAGVNIRKRTRGEAQRVTRLEPPARPPGVPPCSARDPRRGSGCTPPAPRLGRVEGTLVHHHRQPPAAGAGRRVTNVRVVTLLPAATEIVAALGMLDHVVAVSHECDFPPEVNAKPRATHCPIHESGLPSAEVDRWVTDSLRRSGTLYTLDEALLRRLEPEVIITQRLCDVCAVGYASVQAFAETLPGPPRVVDLDPSSLADIMRDVRTVADALGVRERGVSVVAALGARVEAVRARATGAPRRRCVVLEWIDPPFRSGHWTPELVEIAGGVEPLGRKGED